jgi:multiple sugar transport system permease protein
MTTSQSTLRSAAPNAPWRERLKLWLSRDSTQGMIMVAPAVLWLLVLLAYPFVLAIWISFTNKTVGVEGTFTGLQNFTVQWESAIFRRAFFNTLIYTAIATVFKVLLGIGLAMLLNQTFFGRRFVRAALLLPWIVPTVLSTMVWLWMFDSNLSSVNWVLRNLGLIQRNIPWLTDPTMALTSVIIVNVWRGIPFFAITILAALQTVPRELHEAAEIDGAGAFQRFLRVTIPLITPVIAIVTIVSIIGTISDVQVVYALTGGGPNNTTHVLGTLSYRVGLNNGQLGQGAAIALHMFPFLIGLVLLEVWNMRRNSR